MWCLRLEVAVSLLSKLRQISQHAMNMPWTHRNHLMAAGKSWERSWKMRFQPDQGYGISGSERPWGDIAVHLFVFNSTHNGDNTVVWCGSGPDGLTLVCHCRLTDDRPRTVTADVYSHWWCKHGCDCADAVYMRESEVCTVGGRGNLVTIFVSVLPVLHLGSQPEVLVLVSHVIAWEACWPCRAAYLDSYSPQLCVCAEQDIRVVEPASFGRGSV